MNVLKILAPFFLFLTVLIPSPASGEYFRQSEGNKTVIVLVHGILGDRRDTWVRGSNNWPKIISEDDLFKNADIYLAGYETSVWAQNTISEIAAQFQNDLISDGVTDYDNIAFLVHSMGGLVTRKLMMINGNALKRTRFIYFFGTPTLGSDEATFASVFSDNAHLKQMKTINSASYLADQMQDWRGLGERPISYCAYEKKRTYGRIIVSFESASSLCSERSVGILEDHLGIVKPHDEKHKSHVAFRVAYKTQIVRGDDYKELKDKITMVLRKINMVEMQKSGELVPAFSSYIDDPTPENWRVVRSIADSVLTEVSAAMQSAREYDAQFLDLGGEVVSLAEQSSSIANRNYVNTFVESRQQWNGQKNVLVQVQVRQQRPTRQQAMAWRRELEDSIEKLHSEMVRIAAFLK